MRAGTLRHQIIIQAPKPTKNTRGAEADAFDDVATVYANVRTMNGDERQASDQVIPIAAHQVEIRWPLPQALTLTTKHRVKWPQVGNTIRYFGIDAISEPDNRMRRVVLTCTEIVGKDRVL